MATDFWERVRPQGQGFAELRRRTRQIPRALAGMMLAHIGVAVFCFGVVMVKTYEVEKDVRMAVGDSTTVRGYQFTFAGVSSVPGPNYDATRARIDVSQNGRSITQLHPEKRIYRVQQNPMTEAAIDSGLTRDLYVAMGEAVEGGDWIIRVYGNPLLTGSGAAACSWALGGLLAVSDRRYRQKDKKARKIKGDRLHHEIPAFFAATGNPSGPGAVSRQGLAVGPARGAIAADQQTRPGFFAHPAG